MIPTSAMAREKGAMICSVSSVSGTSGMNSSGSDSGSSPWSETFGIDHPAASTAAVSSTIATSGAGTTAVTRGSSTMIAMPTATRG